MANYYLDFVGLNTFIYEPIIYDFDEWTGPSYSATLGKNVFTQVEGIEVGGTYGEFAKNAFGHSDHFYPDINFFGWSSALAINMYKNLKFSHELPNTASFFPALMLHRNGPYGFPMWKQIRIGQNPLTRRQVKENIFTHVIEPGNAVVIDGSNYISRYGQIKQYSESPILSRFKPIEIRGASSVVSERTGRTSLERFTIKSSFGNSISHFDNLELDKYYNFIDKSDDAYDEIKNLYLEDGLDSPDSPMDVFEFVKYSETVYPKQTYANRSYTRQRTNFVFNWRDARSNRTDNVGDGSVSIDNGFGSIGILSQSIWPLDVSSEWGEGSRAIGQASLNGHRGTPANSDFGILLNNYSQRAPSLQLYYDTRIINSYLRPAPFYQRKHTLNNSASNVSPNGMKIEGINYGTLMSNIDNDTTYAGEAMWEAGAQAGKQPFYDSYDRWVQGVRQKGKGYSIIPEFRISNHVATMEAEGFDKKFSNMLEITGGLLSADGSDEESFYKIYSTSEFLKHFDLVKEDHKDFVEPTKIKLRCKAIKKFLPYNGFYPCQRTVEIAKQFYASYSGSISVQTSSAEGFLPITDDVTAQIGLQNLLTPLFAPGVLFNSIKSGIACDYPLVTSSLSLDTENVIHDSGDWYLAAGGRELNLGTTGGRSPYIFDLRIPFRSLVEPENYLAEQILTCQEPHEDAHHSASTFWDGKGDNLYKKMAHNFLAEVPNFFLPSGQFTSLMSKPSNDPNVGNAIAGTTYTMRIKMFKTISGSNEPAPGGDFPVIVPQYTSSLHENFTMYSRPSAFGPPSRPTSSYAPTTANGNRSDLGENYPFTPPYYYGQSWADIKFTPETSKKYTIEEIIRSSEVRYYRYLHTASAVPSSFIGDNPRTETNNMYNNDAMQLSASLNLFAMAELDESVNSVDGGVGIAVDASGDSKSRWTIQPYFETPMLNFNHLSASNSITLPTYGSQSVPRGMWHQYGRIESDPSKGIFMQVTDIPQNFRLGASGSFFDKSLKDLVGFKDEPKRLGQVAASKTISEAVVAIPFIQEGGQRKFFKIDRGTIDFVVKARSMAEDGPVGDSILHMVDMMDKFVIPPSFDFLNRMDLDPFAMYIFEFKHTLTQQDLADIWQNLPPTIGESFAEATATISHDLLAHELLGGGEVIKNQQKKQGNPLPDEIQWMVFKAKQRAEMNYFNKIVGETQTAVGGTGGEDKRRDFTSRRLAKQAAGILRPEGYDADLSYNWPYDFFSLVELVKLDAEVTLADIEDVKKDDNQIVVKRGRRGVAGLPPRAQEKFNQGGGGGRGR